MKIDIVSIFPSYFDVLDISLVGKAAKNKLVDIAVHDLRDVTDDVHKSVDDTPYGGGAGMVMSPEPWGAMLDGLLQEDSWLIVPSPAGQLFLANLWPQSFPPRPTSCLRVDATRESISALSSITRGATVFSR